MTCRVCGRDGVELTERGCCLDEFACAAAYTVQLLPRHRHPRPGPPSVDIRA
jgi:hypothetical protein